MLDIVNADGNPAGNKTAIVAQAIKHWKPDLVQ